MDAAVVGLIGAIIGAAASGLSSWATQRVQARRDEAQRQYAERERWTPEKRALFREVHASAHAWAYLLRRIATAEDAARTHDVVPAEDLRREERRFHELVYDVALLCTPAVSDAVDDLDQLFLEVTNRLGRDTQYGRGASPEDARTAQADWDGGDLPELRRRRVELLRAMRQELKVE